MTIRNIYNEDKNDKREIFAYLRISTLHQSVESQSNAIHQYCKQHGIEKYKIFKDEGISGAKISRPALDDMMKQIKEAEFFRIVDQ